MVEAQFPLKVMEPIRVETPPVGDYLYQVKWDGMRWITYKSATKGTFFQTKGQKVFTARSTMFLKTKFLEWTDEGKLRHAQIV